MFLLTLTIAAQQLPVANNDSFPVHGYTGLPNVLDNDTAPPNSTIAWANILTFPSHGLLYGVGLGRWNYRPDDGFTGVDSFTYEACLSGNVCSAPATVTLTITNAAPVAVSDFYIIKIVSGITPYQFGPLYANDFDPDDPINLTRNPEMSNFPPEEIAIIGAAPRYPPDYRYDNRLYFVQDFSYTGYLFFTYKTTDDLYAVSNEATVHLFVIGNDDHNAGDSSCEFKTEYHVGAPVNVTNGNMWLRQTDYNLPAAAGENIDITRFYNSGTTKVGIFGAGWSTAYDESVEQNGDKMLRLTRPNGQAIYFARTNTTAAFTTNGFQGFYGEVVKNADNTFTLTNKDGSVHKFNTGGKLISLKDRSNNQTTLTYNGAGQLTAVTDAFNRTLTVTPNASGFVGEISDGLGIIATYAYNANGTLQSVTYTDNSKYQFEYTTINNKPYLTTVKDALNNILETHQYDAAGRATTSEADGGVEKYTLDYSNLTAGAGYTQVTDALGRVTKYYVDKSKARNLVTKIEGNCNCGGAAETKIFEYDARLNKTKEIDALGRETVYTYDGQGNRLTTTDTLGTEIYTYNLFGQILTKTDRMNGTTTNSYNAQGNLLTTTDALNKQTTLTYSTIGQLKTVKDARNNTTTLTYDSFGRLLTVKDADNKTTTYGYDARARTTSVKNALNQTTNYEYDLNNRLKKITYPDAKFVTYNYDLAGRRTSMVDARNNTTTYAYDNAYRLTSVTDALNHATSFGYDLMSNRTSVTDALSQTTDYEYDNFNRLKKIIYPAATTGATRLAEQIEYDAVGNVKKRIDTANRETIYDYDTANRLIKTTDADLKQTIFEYNTRSQMTKVKDALNQEYLFDYDALGRTLSQSRAGLSMSFEYDAVGNRTKRIDYNGATTTYNYDVLNRLQTIVYPNTAENVTLTYDAVSQLKTAQNQNGTVSMNYNNRQRMSSETDVWGKVLASTYDANGNRTLLKLDAVNYAAYVYDAANRVTKITNLADAKAVNFGYDNANKLISRTFPNTVTTSYEYDGMSRLKRSKDLKSATSLYDRQYGYNTASQINQITEPTTTRTFGYDVVDRLTSVTNPTSGNESYAFDAVGNRTASHLSASYTTQPFNKLTTTANSSFTYDSNGNMTGKTDSSGTWVYEWDYENRLKKATRPDGQNVIYKYDALGRRIERTPSVGISTKFTHDGQDVLLDQNSDATTIKYLNGLGIDNKLRQTTSSGTASYFLSDHLGSTNALTNSLGAITSQTNYDGFGNQTATLSTRYGYTGRERDDLTGLIYYRARQYSAELGRFISEDPIGFKGGDVNLYGYVKNQSQKLKDPLGLNPYYGGCVAAWGGAGAGIGFLAGGGAGLLAGPGAVVATPGGAYFGAAAGGAFGLGVGGLVCGSPPPFPDFGNPSKGEIKCDSSPKVEPKAEPMSYPTPRPFIPPGEPKRTCKKLPNPLPLGNGMKRCMYQCKGGGFPGFYIIGTDVPIDRECPDPDANDNYWIPGGY